MAVFYCIFLFMVIAKRIQPKKMAVRIEDWKPKPLTPEQLAINQLGGFLVMIETALAGNPKFHPHDIVFEWWEVAFDECYPEEEIISLPHDIIKVAAGLYIKGCEKYEVELNQHFIELNEVIMGEDFYNLSKPNTQQITDSLATHTLLRVTTPTEEAIMATKKKSVKKSAKKAVKKSAKKAPVKKAAKKVVKKAVKTVAKKAPAKSGEAKKLPFSRYVCDKIVNSGMTMEQIAEDIQKAYPKTDYNGMRAVKYYINFIAIGKMEKVGFAPDSIPEDLRKKPVEKKTAEKAEKKVATRKA